MPPAVVFVEEDSQVHSYRRDDDDDWPGGESWEDKLIQPGRLVNVGQGQIVFTPFDMPHPGILYPKRRRKNKKKKKGTTTPPPPPPEPTPSSTGRIGRSYARQLLLSHHHPRSYHQSLRRRRTGRLRSLPTTPPASPRSRHGSPRRRRRIGRRR
jgi:hypothetical protein